MKKITNNPDESTQSFDLTASQRYRKRRKDSPWFWVQLLGGSLVFHGIVLAIALPIARLSAASADRSPTPLEFVELTEAAPEPPVETVAPAEPAPPESAPDQPAPVQSAPVPEPIAPSSIGFAPEPSPVSSPTPSPEVTPEPSPILTPSPEASPLTEVPTAPAEAALPFPQPESLPLPVQPSTPAAEPLPEPVQPERSAAVPSLEAPIPETPIPETPAPEASPIPEAPASELSTEPPIEPTPDSIASSEGNRPQPSATPEVEPTDPGLQTTPIDAPVPDVSETIAAAPSTVDSDNLDSVNNQATAPTGVTLSLTGTSRITPLAGAPVETLEMARPIESSTTFLPDPSSSACQVTPDILNRARTPIALRITTNDRGGVENVLVSQSSGSPEYDQLAACLVKEQWRFEPATAMDAGGTQRLPIYSDELQIILTISPN
jgi:hypothetical protein